VKRSALGLRHVLSVVGLLIEATAAGIVSGAWLERRTRRAVEGLRDHDVICGYGRVGRPVAEEFRAAGVARVIVEDAPAAAAAARERGEVVVDPPGSSARSSPRWS